MGRKPDDVIDINDAMDNLAAIASIDGAGSSPLGIVKKHRIVTTKEEFAHDTVEWLSGEGVEPIFDILDLTYRSIHSHLLQLYENPEMNWENERTRKGIASMMALVGESAPKLEAFLVFRLGEALPQHIADREEFKALQRFYNGHLANKFAGTEPSRGLKDFETVRSDSEYELFYIRNESGEPYFNAELLRNIKLNCDFDLEGESFEEDPILKVRAMEDRDLHASAGQILGECHGQIADFYAMARKLEENELGKSLGMALTALFLSANPRYLLPNTTFKSCLQYFHDFQKFLRRAMKTSEYQKLIAYPPDNSDKGSLLLLEITHALCKSLFERVGGVKLESIGLIHRVMRRGEEIKQKEQERLLKGESLWNRFLLDDDKYRTLLAQFPNGPLFKILDLIHEEQDEDTIVPFDPISQANLPSRIYEVQRKGKKIDVLRLPSPTRQGLIHKAELVDEFRGFLRALAMSASKGKHLLINLQDRTSWKEYARSKTLEAAQLNAEFSHHLFVITLPKHTDFYYQSNEYLEINQADDFLRIFLEQLAKPEECGYFFPPQVKQHEIFRFAETALPAIHALFFQNKKSLTRRNREDFIEIFTQFLILKCIDLLEPTSLSFTCKDAIDTGPAQQSMFYGFMQLLTGDFSDRGTQDFLRWLLYTPALFIRERPIDAERFNRAICTLECLDEAMGKNGTQILKTFSELYHPQTFKTLGVKHL